METVEYRLPDGFNPPRIRLPRQQTAIVQDAEGKGTIRHDQSLPVHRLEPHHVLVKTVAVSINPCDWKMPSKFPTEGARIGCDFTGTVIAIGPHVKDRWNGSLALGDRVCGGVHGSNPIDLESSSFVQFIAADANNLLLRLPEHVSWEAGAVLGAASVSTLSIVFDTALKLTGTPEKPLVTEKPFYVLVYGASTNTGTMALQLLKLSGYTPIATCSPHNFPLVRKFGAAAAFDYRSPTCADDIRSFTGRTLSHVLDVITDARSQMLCGNVFGRGGGMYAVLELPDPESPVAKRRTVKTEFVVGLAAIGKEVALSGGYERPADHRVQARSAHDFAVVQRLLDEDKVRAHPAKVISPGGFSGILEGIKILRDGGTSGEKLVVFLEETAEK
ncbi:zinc binding enoyl reductase [Zopfia rhizophila CBS 207.26]|uniref:Zinc binding enoyl reductase n=1 Tax=Zopfia rhizophila CBS 207.26 TaxID=1314779 RepID=A0A6A6EUU8_9PEZI|nr:zinc binding enoyl reductase [Zopfia rhizophila CBS 207.26]